MAMSETLEHCCTLLDEKVVADLSAAILEARMDLLDKRVREFLWGEWAETKSEHEEVEALKRFAHTLLEEAGRHHRNPCSENKESDCLEVVMTAEEFMLSEEDSMEFTERKQNFTRYQTQMFAEDYASALQAENAELRGQLDKAKVDSYQAAQGWASAVLRAEAAEQALAEAREAKDAAYSERDNLVAALSKLFPSSLERHPDLDTDWDGDWRWIVFIELPTGQATWHIHDSELAMFNHLPRHTGKVWDSHTTPQKYLRLAALTAASRPGVEKLARCPKCGSTDIKLGIVKDYIRVLCHNCPDTCVVTRVDDFAQFFPALSVPAQPEEDREL